MKRAKLTSKDLDSIGRLVVRAGAADESEIERIVSNPRLFDGVLYRIATGVKTDHAPARSIWKPVLVSAAVAAVMAVSAIGYLRSGSDAMAITPRVLPVIYKVDESKEPFKAEERFSQPGPDEPRVVPAVLNRTPERQTEVRPRPKKTKPIEVREADFHAIGFTANAEDAVLDGRVVRVEMPRSALFALGVDLPLENGTKAVKADLLVGSDGTPRGIRLVE